MKTLLKNIAISPVNMEDRVRVDIRAGDTVRVWIKVEEKGKTRVQPFEGVVLARKHGAEPGATFTVRRTAGGFGVEKTFPLYSPVIDKVEIMKRTKVRRAKLYHIRDKAAREIKRQMRNMKFVDIRTASDLEEQAKAAEAESAAQDEEAEKAEVVSSEPAQPEEVKEAPAPEKEKDEATEKKDESAEAPKEKETKSE